MITLYNKDLSPSIILVEPQLPENIGTTARAMLNCGLTDLRLVRPRESWPNPRAGYTSAGADVVLENAKLFDSAKEATADLSYVFATSARMRGMNKEVVTPRIAVQKMCDLVKSGTKFGVIFGPERTGLTNDDLAIAETAIMIPLNAEFLSLNLAQAVLIISYEWFLAAHSNDKPKAMEPTHLESLPASKELVANMLEHLFSELDKGDFFSSSEKRPRMVRNIQNFFQRAGMTEQEVRTMHGMIVALTGRARERSGKD